MDYFKAFEKIKTALEKTDISPADGHFAVQVRLTDDDCGGIFYIEQKDRQLFVEPYDYYDNNADVTASFKDFSNIAAGKLDAKKAADDGKIFVNGNAEEFFRLAAEFKPKKAPAKKNAAKASDKKTVKKSAAPKKTTAKKEKTTAKTEKVSDAAKKPVIPEKAAVLTEKTVAKAETPADTKPLKKKTK